MMENRIMIITGMHRSGTSVITQWLNRCGLHIGNELVGAETGNEEGHFEDLDFLHAHQSILRGRQVTDEGYTDPIKNLSFQERGILNDIIFYKNDLNSQWGWKDPRTCLFLDTYRQLIPEAFYFVAVRSYQAVVSSLILRIYRRTEKKYALRRGLSKLIWVHVKRKRRMKLLLKKYSQRYLAVWITSNEAIAEHLQQISPLKYIVTDIASLNLNDQAIFRHLTNEWGFALQCVDFKNIYKDNMTHAPLNVDKYIKDKSLLARAAAVEASLKRLSIFNNLTRQVHLV